MIDEDLLSALFNRLGQRDDLGPAERQALCEAAGDVRTISAGRDISRLGERPKTSTLLSHGLTARYNLLEDGGRQITAFHIAGDFVDLHGFLLKTMDHGVRAMSECTVVSFPHPALVRITEQFPHLTRMLWLATLLDSAIHRQWLVTKGRMTALNQMAHLLCEHLLRAKVVGIAVGNRFPFPITQADLADALGISSVHVNRTLQELRSLELVEWEDGWVTIRYEAGLRRLAEFDDTYLHLRQEPR
jgi:CRP-like cAMP-binding protein